MRCNTKQSYVYWTVHHLDSWVKSHKLLRMDVLTSETCWALNNEIIKQVTSSWSLFIQLQSSLFTNLQANSLSMFQVSTTPITRSTQNCNYSLRYWSYFLCSYLPPMWPTWPCWREVAAQKIWPVPEAVVTVLCTPDDGCGWHPKHVKWTCRLINRLLGVASRWTIINIDQRCTEP